jgi:hypothetical protein
MKKLIIPGFLMLFAMGLGQQNAKADGFSFGISIGDDHRYRTPAPVVVAPPQVISAPPVVVAQPRVVVADPPCAPGYVVVRECDRAPYWGRGYRGWHSHERSEHRRDRR